MSSPLPTDSSFHKPDLDSNRPLPIEWATYRTWLTNAWSDLLNSAPDESAVQHFLERNPCLVPAAGGAGYEGVQGEGLFTQPELQGIGTNRVPDFMWITATSTTVYPTFIEIEKPGKVRFNASSDDTFSSHFNQALNQLTQWKAWWSKPANQQVFRDQVLDPIWDFKSRDIDPQYVLIYGRRAELEQGPPSQRASMLAQLGSGGNVHLMSYDRLKPDRNFADFPTVKQHSNGQVSLRAVSPTFTTGPGMIDYLTSRIKSPALNAFQNSLWTPERSEYVRERWLHWAACPSGIHSDEFGE